MITDSNQVGFMKKWVVDFRKEELESWVAGSTYKGAPEGDSGYRRLPVETFMGETLCPAHAMNF